MTEVDFEARRALLATACRKTVHVISGVSGQGVKPLLFELMKQVQRQRELEA
jgi:GTP-binding protein